ncbi:MAG: DUF3737 family protein [Prevotellaceae bacterium]|nr:DUF3737 family protein [Prevotellaceae bacterium]
MKIIKDKEYGGERPLYKEHDLRLERVTIHVGESSLKETHNIEAQDCQFEGKYVFWECRGFRVTHCKFVESSRSSLWYSSDVEMRDCLVEAPKLFRRMQGISVYNCRFLKAQETLWDCDNVVIAGCFFQDADYFGMHTNNVRASNYHQEGNYAFQYSQGVEIRDSLLNSKDALWESENVTIYDSVINGEYFAWYAKNLRLVRCHITGEQPLCYCENLVMEDCTMGDDANLAFEYSSIHATINGDVVSVKNPTSGRIEVRGHIGEVIIDLNQKQPANCIILYTKHETN